MRKEQKDFILATLDDIEHNAATALAAVNVGTVCLACMLGYIDFRHAYLNWREGRPKLSAFEKGFAARPSMKAWPLA